MNEIAIQCEHGPQLLISRSPDGKYLVKVLSSVGQMVAHLFVSIEEMGKLQEVLDGVSRSVG